MFTTTATHRNGLSGLARRRGRRRGLVLILVVALCATLAILGTTFLFISRTDRRRTSSIEYRQRANLAAQQLVAEARALLKEDLHIGVGGTRPYQDLSTEPRRFFDYAGETNGSNPVDDADLHLASPEMNWLNRWPHLTNLTGAENGDYEDALPSGLDNVTGYRYTAADAGTQGELRGEAKSFKYGTLDAAVRIVDLGGLINVNTGYSNDLMDSDLSDLDIIKPVCVGLKQYLSAAGVQWDTTPDYFNQVRCGGLDENNDARASEVYDELASRLYNPGPNTGVAFTPYAISDEPYLRWLGTNGEAISGRLWKHASMTPRQRQHLTTMSISRGILREPMNIGGTNYYVRLNLNTNIGGVGLSHLTNADARTALYNYLANAGADTDKAGHFVANLFAYLHTSSEATAYNYAYDFAYDGKVAYGVVPQPVIVEAYAKYTASTLEAPEDDSVWGSAIEVYNPYNTNMNVIIGNTDGTAIDSTPVTIPAGERRVFYSFGKGADSTETVDALFNVPPATINSADDWFERSEVDFMDANTVAIIREAQDVDGNTIQLVMDQVSTSDLTFSGSGTTDDEKNLSRDDDPVRKRYNVASCKAVTNSGHTLGAENGITEAEIPYLTCVGGFGIAQRSTNIQDLNELYDIYITGTTKNGSTFEPFTAKLDEFMTETIHVSRGRADPYGGPNAGGNFPLVRWPCLFGEIFDCLAPDSTDSDFRPASMPDSRYYGRVNINTATEDVLKKLPWPASLTVTAGEATATITREEMALALVEYRDGVDRTAAVDYIGYPRGFSTPGQLSQILADLVRNKLVDAGMEADDMATPDYRASRNALYSYVSNVITTQSDVYAVYILLKDPVDDEKQWRYLAVIDRSNCWTSSDEPALLLFTPLK